MGVSPVPGLPSTVSLLGWAGQVCREVWRGGSGTTYLVEITIGKQEVAGGEEEEGGGGWQPGHPEGTPLGSRGDKLCTQQTACGSLEGRILNGFLDVVHEIGS